MSRKRMVKCLALCALALAVCVGIAAALVISKKLGWRLPMAYLATDLTVLLLSLSYIPPVKIACSLVTVTISSFLIGKLEGRGEKAQTTA